jgi:ABC-type proline/glycine betaine transport system permease subunit
MSDPVVPLVPIINAVIGWAQHHLDVVFSPLKHSLEAVDTLLRSELSSLPPLLLIALACGSLLIRRQWKTGIAVAVAAAVILNLGLWRAALDTLSLVGIAAGIALVVGIPLGITMVESRVARAIIEPILDYMQSTPAFVYLIPSILFFGIGTVPGVIATAAFSLPPVTRSVALGLAQVPFAAIEAAVACGATRLQVLRKVKVPLSRPYIFAGINQCIMMALSMVVVCALIGARGLGVEVVTALTQMNLAKGIESGIAVVLLAFVLDRLCWPARSEFSERSVMVQLKRPQQRYPGYNADPVA